MLRFSLLICFLFASGAVLAQDPDAIQKIKEQIRQLYAEWNKARLQYDREALEKIFADDYLWVHGFGYADDKTAAINDQLQTDSIRPVPVPDLDGLSVHDDVAILKRLNKGPQGSNYNTNIFIKKGGRWMFLFSQTTLFQPERKTIPVSASLLKEFSGRYQLEGRELVMAVENDTLVVKMPGVPKRLLFAVSENRFFDKLGTEYVFQRDGQGRVTQFTLRPQRGAERSWKRQY